MIKKVGKLHVYECEWIFLNHGLKNLIA